jgi:hypothetical protein
MPTRRIWTDDDIAKLKNMAGKAPVEEIATELGRTLGATIVEASKLGVSVRTRPHFGRRPPRVNREASLER